MLYLAEVQKVQKSFMSGSKVDLKLLACQRTDQSWSAVPGDEVIPAPEEANSFNAGVLVLVDLSGNRQVQRPPTEAGRQLVTILQNFSRQLEKSKKDEEEIDQWKHSLTYQGQELNRREMEIEARLEQLQQMEQELEQMKAKRQEINSTREQAEKLRVEVERKRKELEGAWEHLRGEQRRFEDRQTEQATVLDTEQATKIQELLNHLSNAIAPTDSVREHINLAFEVVNSQQAALDYHWQQLEQQAASAQQIQAEVDSQSPDLQNLKQEWQQMQVSVEDAQSQLKVQQNALQIKQESVQMLSQKLQTQEELYQQIYRLTTTVAEVKVSQKIDLEALEKMPLGNLQEMVQNLQKDLEKVVRFVNDQEEELTLQRESVEELQAKIQQVSEYDRINLETELADEQDRYQMLDDTLGGQRRNLREREEFLNQHIRVLRRRQGVVESDNNQKIALEPILNQLGAQRQQQEEELQKLQNQIEQMQLSIEQLQTLIEGQTSEHEAKHHEWQSMEQHLQDQRAIVAELWGKVNVYQETLQPMQDSLNGIREKLEAIATTLNQFQEFGDYQLWAIAEIQQTLGSLM